MNKKTATLAEALNHYKSRVSILKKGFVQEAYRIKKISKSELAKLPIRSITSVDIATYRDQRLTERKKSGTGNISASTVRLELSLLSNVFDIARIEWGLCGDNPVKDVRKPKPPPGRDRRLTAREERLILRYCNSHSNTELFSIVTLALETAMRQGEILSMKWEDINLKSRVVRLHETKNGSKRDVPLTLAARDAITRLGVKNNGKVFEYSSSGIKSTWRFMREKLKIENLHFHDLRHEAISRLFETTSLDAMEVAAISGHKSLSMLKRYTHLKAHKLVRKLEAGKNKSRQIMLSSLIPYPAEIKKRGNVWSARLLDFDESETLRDDCKEIIVKRISSELLRVIIFRLKDGSSIPKPDQYLDCIHEAHIQMIDPLISK